MRQPVIGIMDRDLIAFDKIGRKDHQVGATGVTQRRKQDAAKGPAVMIRSASFHDRGIFLSMRAAWRQAQSHSFHEPSQVSGWKPCERSTTSASVILYAARVAGGVMLVPCLYSSSAVCVERDR
ncbi:hypothetical protein X741_33195 [Mesorhizobium sp. LNHC229A00]|nr:hypothetical protein X741_33195 [Mesorhizobium sp. LNHC229A00]